jgi:hypothetical protein
LVLRPGSPPDEGAPGKGAASGPMGSSSVKPATA